MSEIYINLEIFILLLIVSRFFILILIPLIELNVTLSNSFIKYLMVNYYLHLFIKKKIYIKKNFPASISVCVFFQFFTNIFRKHSMYRMSIRS